jgi:hypothetical protein
MNNINENEQEKDSKEYTPFELLPTEDFSGGTELFPITENPLTKSLLSPLGSREIANSIKSAIDNGEIDVAKIAVILKRIAKVQEIVWEDKKIKKTIENELKKYVNQRTGNVYGAVITEAAVYTDYDFKVCGHPVLDSLYQIQKEVKEKIKELEDSLKEMIPSSFEASKLDFNISNHSKTITVEELPRLIWESSGEELTIFPPNKFQRDGLKFNNL